MTRRPGPAGGSSRHRCDSVGQVPPRLTSLSRSQCSRPRVLHGRPGPTKGLASQAQAIPNMGRPLQDQRLDTPGGLQAQEPRRDAGLPQQFLEYRPATSFLFLEHLPCNILMNKDIPELAFLSLCSLGKPSQHRVGGWHGLHILLRLPFC